MDMKRKHSALKKDMTFERSNSVTKNDSLQVSCFRPIPKATAHEQLVEAFYRLPGA